MSDRMWCPVYTDEHIDEGPLCCDLTCVFEGRWYVDPLRWEGDDS